MRNQLLNSWARARLGALGVAGCLIAVACGSGTDDAASSTTAQTGTDAVAGTSVETVVTSDDGALTLTIPAGAMPDGSEITITRADGAADLVTDDGRIVGDVYDLQPSGLQFAEPATVERRIPIDSITGPDGRTILATVIESDGVVELAEEQQTEIDGDEAIHTFRIGHFSRVFTVETRLVFSVEPADAGTVDVGDTIDFTAAWARTAEGLDTEYDDTPISDLMLDRPFTLRWQVPVRPLPTTLASVVFEEWDGTLDLGAKNARVRCDEVGDGEVVIPLIADGLYDDPAMHSWLITAMGFGELFEVPPPMEGFSSGRALAASERIPISCVAPVDGGTGTDDTETGDGVVAAGDDDSSGCADGVGDGCATSPAEPTAPWTVEITPGGDCGWRPPARPDGESYLWPDAPRDGDPFYNRSEGWALLLGTVHAPFLQFDDGELVAGIEPRGDEPLTEWEVLSVVRGDNTVTIVVDETRFDDGVPCTQQMTYVYTFPGGLGVLDWMASVPGGDGSDIDIVTATANYDDGVASVVGQITGGDDVWLHVHMECSGEEIVYAVVAVHRDDDGNFEVAVDLPDCIVVNMTLVAGGTRIGNTSVSN